MDDIFSLFVFVCGVNSDGHGDDSDDMDADSNGGTQEGTHSQYARMSQCQFTSAEEENDEDDGDNGGDDSGEWTDRQREEGGREGGRKTHSREWMDNGPSLCVWTR